jgi:hypothetical protein
MSERREREDERSDEPGRSQPGPGQPNKADGPGASIQRNEPEKQPLREGDRPGEEEEEPGEESEPR